MIDALFQRLDVPPRRRIFDIGVVTALALSHALTYTFATVTLDTARDLAATQSILDGEIAMRGPILNGLFNLGPLWFYLLAPVLALTKSQAVALLWVGVLASLKFPLAYRLGKAIRDADLGLCLAAVIALPGWSSFGAVFPTHTVMIEAAVLLQAHLMFMLAQGSRARYWAGLGFASGLALHAHPSAVCVLALLPAVLWCRRRILSRHDLIGMVMGGLLFALPLIPMLVAEYRESWPAFSPSLAYATQSTHHFTIGSALQIMQGTLVEGPRIALGLGGGGVLIEALYISVMLLALLGLFVNVWAGVALERMMLAMSLLALLLLSFLLSGLRDYTPFYMALVLLPFWYAAVAIGLRRLPLVRLWIVAAMVLALSGNALLITSAKVGHARIDVARLSNVQNAMPKFIDAALLPATQLDALGRALCDADHEVVLHGYLAVLYDASLALGPELWCGKRTGVVFSGPGSAGSAHWLGLPPLLAKRLGLQHDDNWNSTPKVEVHALWPTKPLEPADRTRYPHHRATGALAVTHTWTVQSAAGNALVTTDLLYPYRINKVGKVSANGRVASKQAEMNITQVWVCADCGNEAIEWQVEGLSNDPDVLDIVSIKLPLRVNGSGEH